MTENERRTGWFDIPGIQDGVRNLKGQIQGLQHLSKDIVGKTILDLGAAEGLIGKYYLDMGASLYHGIELVQARCDLGAELLAAYPDARMYCADLEHLEAYRERNKELLPRYDVVLLLSIVQKFAQPKRFLEQAVQMSSDWVAVRAPDVKIVDKRSRFIELDIEKTICGLGFELVHQGISGQAEWLGLFRRKKN